MKLRAPNVYRWTERMNLAAIGDGEFWNYGEEFYATDDLPDTLVALLRHIFADWGPELAAYAAHYNAWVRANPAMPPGHLVSGSQERRVHPMLGEVTYVLRGGRLRRRCAVQALWHFDRAASLARNLSGEPLGRWQDLLRHTGGEPVMAITLERGIERRNNLLVTA
jgi:hypothetical protein